MDCFKLKFIKFYSFMVGIFTDAQLSWASFLCQIQSWNNSSGYNCTKPTNNHFWRLREVTSWVKTERERKEKLDWSHDLIEFTDLTIILKPWCGSLHKKTFQVSLFVCQVKYMKNKNKMVKKGTCFHLIHFYTNHKGGEKMLRYSCKYVEQT